MVNLAASEAGWFACVYGAANAMPWLGPIIVLALLLLHLRLAKRPMMEMRVIMSAVLLGLFADSILVASGWVSYPSGNWVQGLAPYWILAMWALFATTLNVSMKWLRRRKKMAVVLGAAGGPLAYMAGEGLGGIRFEEPIFALSALAIIWAMAMPLLVSLATRWDGMSERVSRPDYILTDWRTPHHA